MSLFEILADELIEKLQWFGNKQASEVDRAEIVSALKHAYRLGGDSHL